MVDKHFILLDAARLVEKMDLAQKLNRENVCVYNQIGDEALKRVGPYLFALGKQPEFLKWYRLTGWGDSWGIMIEADASIEKLQQHLIQFKTAKTEDKEVYFFRYYDPRVLRIFLPTCDAQQLKSFFGPIRSFIMEDEDPAFALKFSLEGSQLKQEKIPAGQVFGDNVIPPTASTRNAQPVQQPVETKPRHRTFIINKGEEGSGKA